MGVPTAIEEICFGFKPRTVTGLPRHVGSAATWGHRDRICVTRRRREVDSSLRSLPRSSRSGPVALNGLKCRALVARPCKSDIVGIHEKDPAKARAVLTKDIFFGMNILTLVGFVVMGLTLTINRTGQGRQAWSIGIMAAGTALVFLGLYAGGGRDRVGICAPRPRITGRIPYQNVLDDVGPIGVSVGHATSHSAVETS